MSGFSDRVSALDSLVFDRLSDGLAVIDNVEISATFEQASFMFESSARANEQTLIVSQSLAREKGVSPRRDSSVVWQGQPRTLAEPPIYESGLIRLILN